MKKGQMKTKRNFVCCVAAAMAAAMVTSCGQDVADETGVAEQQETQRVTTVAELTQQLRAYDAALMGCTRAEISSWADPSGMAVTNARMGIALADAAGAAYGAIKGGLQGAIAGAAVFSVKKLLDKLLPKFFFEMSTPTIFVSDDCAPMVNDSVGYYHNLVETRLCNQYTDTPLPASNVLLAQADQIIRSESAGYRAKGMFTVQQQRALIAGFDTFRAEDRNYLSFDDYADLLKQMDTASSDYIDFAAEYLFTVFYGNVDIDDYTEEVLFMINNSNADVEDIGVLDNVIQVAHASTIFSANIK